MAAHSLGRSPGATWVGIVARIPIVISLARQGLITSSTLRCFALLASMNLNGAGRAVVIVPDMQGSGAATASPLLNLPPGPPTPLSRGFFLFFFTSIRSLFPVAVSVSSEEGEEEEEVVVVVGLGRMQKTTSWDP